MRILFSAPDFAWPPVRGGHVRVLSQLRVLASLPEVEQIRVFWLREDPLAWREGDGIERAIPKTSVARPVFHPIHLRRHPRYIPRVAWLRFAHGVPYVAGKWESPTVRRALAAELRATPFDAVWLGALGTSRYLPLIRRLSPGARVILDVHFPNPNKRATTIRFKGVVVRRLREGPPYETSVRFGSRGRFLRDQSEDLFEAETVVDAEATGRWSAR